MYYTLLILIGICHCVSVQHTERNASMYSYTVVPKCLIQIGAGVRTVRHRCRTVRTLRHYNLVPKCPGAEVSWCRCPESATRPTPEFISPDLWPLNSPDLNPVEREYKKRIRDVDDEKQRLVEVWSDFGHTLTRRFFKSSTLRTRF